MPSLGLVISKLLALPPALSVGLILLASCPGGTASNVVSVPFPLFLLMYIVRYNVFLLNLSLFPFSMAKNIEVMFMLDLAKPTHTRLLDLNDHLRRNLLYGC